METDVLIVGCGCSGLYCALNLPRDKRILMITSSDAESSDSYLAQGGMCMLKDDSDYDSYFEDTLKAGHYENDKKSVEIMIRSSRDVVKDLIETGADFKKDEQGNLTYTKEGAHSSNRIIFHEDVTGKEITSHLLERVRELPNVTLLENTRMLDIISYNNECLGAVIRKSDNSLMTVKADVTVLATGGIGGLYRHSTNFRHLTGDSIAIAVKHNVELKDINYVQIHPTTFYSKDEKDRSFLISESVRGEGAKLYDKNGDRFVNELLPRDLLEKRCKEEGFSAYFDYSWQWNYKKQFEEAGIMGLLGTGFDPGVTSVFSAYALKHYFDEIDTIDILDCNGGDHGYPFATNFNPEINLREVSAPGSYWEDGHWVEVPAMSIKREYDFPQVGMKDMYLLHHEEIESLAKNIPGVKRIRFFMTFGQSYLTHMKCLENVGMLRTDPVKVNGVEVVPIQLLKELLPDPATLGERTVGKTNIGCIFRGRKDGKEKTIYIYNVCDHQECYREVESQAISYTTGVPAMIGTMMVVTGMWNKAGVYNVEEFDPDPYMEALNKWGLPWVVEENPQLVE